MGRNSDAGANFANAIDKATMARDKGLEELVYDELRSTPGITDKAMFGGWAWLLGGNLLCGARDDGMLVRLGKGNDAWALAITGIEPMLSRGKHMYGWVRADARVYGDDKMRHNLIASALQFVGSLPKK
ncbi:Conserved hypothetical protein [Acidithiobacillus ferrivorans]|uniref:TfoX N-terminal domain-containing protein n=1 Tax=Acidithiobacillus ferrivorans TaxID=160808 RepID=A0ABY1MU83_9PROT|nr:Conserved hypothetical protein [Acidithiobacillus ferrivorans]